MLPPHRKATRLPWMASPREAGSPREVTETPRHGGHGGHATAGNEVASLCFVFNLLATLLCLNGIREATRELPCQAHSMATHQV